jgi:hypothetical protein
LEQWGALVMAWFEGRSLREIAMDRHVSNQQTFASIKRVGRWIAEFHGSTSRGTQRVDVPLMLSQLDGIASCAKLSSKNMSLLQLARSRLENEGQIVSNIDLPSSWQHGDLKPANILLGLRTTAGIDLQLKYEGVVAHDLAQFWTNLEISCYHPCALQRLLILRPAYDAFVTSYLSSSLMDAASLRTVLAWMRVNQSARQLALHGSKNRWLAFAAGRTLRRAIRDAARARAATLGTDAQRAARCPDT